MNEIAKEYFEWFVESVKSKPSVFIIGLVVGLFFGSVVF